MAKPWNLFWNELQEKAAQVWTEVKGEASEMWDNIKPVVEKDIVAALGQLKDVAFAVVTDLATAEYNKLTGGEKLSTAATKIFEHAETQGIQITLGDAQGLAQDVHDALAVTRPAATAT